MPELFGRMAERMARDPASGFGGFLDDLAGLEGPALAGVPLSREQERQEGRKARAEYLQRAAARGYRLVDDPARLGYLKSLVGGISRQMRNGERYPAIEVQLIEAPVPDAQSFPGGFLVFTSALLEEPDEATVAAVVAHELAHLDRGHLYQYARRARLAEATYGPGTMTGPGDFNRFMTRQMALFGLMMHPFRPEHEHEADCDAVTWLYREGYDPEALGDFFTRLNARRRDTPEDALPFFEILRSHPYSLERREHVMRRLDQLQRWKPRADLGRYPENLRALKSRFEPRAAGEQPAP
jgi:predicted Zn-dependent protease